MIRKLISRVFGGKSHPEKTVKTPGRSARNDSDSAAVIPVRNHGVRREQLSSGARRTVEGLQKAGYKAYVVGGAVRDLIAGIPPKDFDVATNATPEQVRACFRRSRIIGRRFQIVHVMMGAETIEVTT
ncbi:MAG TPA: polynucleotide adenylyltransferase PcnB, partial [Azospira sp.]|nr:polynucleotide adenylyltransferase PcnB [Azospira sp.]